MQWSFVWITSTIIHSESIFSNTVDISRLEALVTRLRTLKTKNIKMQKQNFHKSEALPVKQEMFHCLKGMADILKDLIASKIYFLRLSPQHDTQYNFTCNESVNLQV